MNTTQDVRIVRLNPLHVAAALGFGSSPELQAWQKLRNWMQNNGMTNMQDYRFFGFNNPNPHPGSPNYGYEQWVTADIAAQGDESVSLKDVPGGLYAVMRCEGVPNQQIWEQLVAWRERSPYLPAQHQWLEECLTPDMPTDESKWRFDLYLPIAER